MPVGSHILIVEDDAKIAEALKRGLQAESYSVSVAGTGEEAFFLLHSQAYSLVLLDVMLPGRSGIEILRAVREKHLGIPVLLLTAKDSIEDRVEGLDAGADDYLVKPFAFPELLARVRSLLRRAKADSLTKFQIADLELDIPARRVMRNGSPIDLTLKEFDLLSYLSRHKGSIVSREMLAKDVWKENIRATPLDNVIDVHMARLRKKIDSESKVKLIHTVRGVGFVLREVSE
jgi:two-component system, OmpR family, copper resistance phosphate regulon response regulator CusR